MRSKLREKWQPSERCYKLLENRGMPREWVGHQIPDFKLYWLDAGLVMQSWDTVFNRWVSKNWEKVDKRRMLRSDIDKMHDQIFDGVKVTGPGIIEKKYRPKPPKLKLVKQELKKELTKEERNALADKWFSRLFK